jgi:hypothetical protein
MLSLTRGKQAWLFYGQAALSYHLPGGLMRLRRLVFLLGVYVGFGGKMTYERALVFPKTGNFGLFLLFSIN